MLGPTWISYCDRAMAFSGLQDTIKFGCITAEISQNKEGLLADYP